MKTPVSHDSKQKGFILILSMLMMLILTILVVNAVRATTLNEKTSGGYMDRSRAQSLAELAITEGQHLLVNSSQTAEQCRTGCKASNQTTVVAQSVKSSIPSAWSDSGAITASKANAKFNIVLLNDTYLPPTKANTCTPYSVMGRGIGNDPRTQVVLQVVSFVCDN